MNNLKDAREIYGPSRQFNLCLLCKPRLLPKEWIVFSRKFKVNEIKETCNCVSFVDKSNLLPQFGRNLLLKAALKPSIKGKISSNCK